MNVRPVRQADRREWLRMRASLWPAPLAEHSAEIGDTLSVPPDAGVVLVAERDDGDLCGFLEARTRSHAEGCHSSPVAYIEGWWVDPDQRRTGVGSRLVAAVQAWARDQGLTEVASDSECTNDEAQEAHRALGFEEVDRIVCFRKAL